ncbi:putative guanine nucleotide-exchange factor Sed4p [[Candida] railenensis]|uniref:Guanine nucleotide-exchange factor SEC12 n=1 Tax=[Candida] railenensis TaxID=45579 RepID=A0A9P0QPA6_9ASCO|nr:putative guanine nucleotide-exchange factor Sed4p [[Candida] railenensis]
MGGIKKSATLYLDYPIYGAKFINNKTVLVAGGGGEGNNGIPNKITAVKCFFKATDKSKILQKFREITLPKNEDSPMCLDVAKNGTRDDGSYSIFVGCNQSIQLIQSMNINNSLRKYTYSKDEHLRFLDAAQLEPVENPDDDTGGAKTVEGHYPKIVYLSSNNSIGAFMTSKGNSIYIFEPEALDTKFVFTPQDESEIKDFHISPEDDGKTLCYVTSKSIETISTITSNPISSSLANPKSNAIFSKYILSKVKYTDNSHVLVTATARGRPGAKPGVTLFLYRLSDQTIVRQKLISTKIKGITSIDYSPAQELIALAGNDYSVNILRLSDFKTLQVFKKLHEFPVTRVAFSPNGQTLASVSAGRVLNVMKIPPNFAKQKSTIGTLFNYLILSLIVALLGIGFKKGLENGQLVKGLEISKEYGIKGIKLANEYTHVGISFIKEKLKDEDQTNSEDSSTYFKIEPEELKKLTVSSDEVYISTTSIDPELYSLTSAIWATSVVDDFSASEETYSSPTLEAETSSIPLKDEARAYSEINSASEETSSISVSSSSESVTLSSSSITSVSDVSVEDFSLTSQETTTVETAIETEVPEYEEVEEIEYVEEVAEEDHEYVDEIVEEEVEEGEGEGDGNDEIVIIEIEEIEEEEQDEAPVTDSPSTVEEVQVEEAIELDTPVVETELTEETKVADAEPIIAVDDFIDEETIVKVITHTVTLDDNVASSLTETTAAPIADEEPTVESILEQVSSAAETVVEHAEPVVDYIRDEVPPIVESLVEEASVVVDKVSEQSTYVEEAVSKNAPAANEEIESAAPIVEDIVKDGAQVVEEIIEQAAPIVESITEQAAPIVESITEQAAPIIESVTEVVEQIIESAEPSVVGIVNEANPDAVVEEEKIPEAHDVSENVPLEIQYDAEPVVQEIVEQVVPVSETLQSTVPEPTPVAVPEPEVLQEPPVEEVNSEVSPEPSSESSSEEPSKSKIIRTKTKRIVKKVKKTKAPDNEAHDEL